TRASDIFAFGLLIDEMVTSSRAFSAGSVGALYYQRLCEEPISPRQRNDHLLPVWDQTILRCLARNPADRFQSAGQAVAALETGVRPAPKVRRFSLRFFAIAAAIIVFVLF